MLFNFIQITSQILIKWEIFYKKNIFQSNPTPKTNSSIVIKGKKEFMLFNYPLYPKMLSQCMEQKTLINLSALEHRKRKQISELFNQCSITF